MSLLDLVLNQAIDSGFLKSRIQALARALAVAGGTYLVQHGLATQDISNALVGAVVGLVALYLQDLDVRVVDGKIRVALSTPSKSVDPVIPVTVETLPPVNDGKNGRN